MTFVLYGETNEEKIVKEKQFCREVVKEVFDCGISERQKYILIKMFADNLENFHHMREITELVDSLVTTDVGELLHMKEARINELQETALSTGEK
jgi:hypothetical protein